MTRADTVPSPEDLPRGGRMRERRGRGKRGPLVLAGPLTPSGVPMTKSPRDDFDALVLSVVDRLRPRLRTELDSVEFGVEEAPLLPDAWDGSEVPLTSIVQAPGDRGQRSRIVLFRLPIVARSSGPVSLTEVVHTIVVEQLADLWNRDVDDIDPDTT